MIKVWTENDCHLSATARLCPHSSSHYLLTLQIDLFQGIRNHTSILNTGIGTNFHKPAIGTCLLRVYFHTSDGLVTLQQIIQTV